MKRSFYLFFFIPGALALAAGAWYFYNRLHHPSLQQEIDVFKAHDKASPPPRHAILFIGSSSFRDWNLKAYFPGYSTINRGFGGSTLPDVMRYAEDIIFAYEPKQIVLYAGENDLAVSDTVTAEMVAERLKQLFRLIRKRLPDTAFLFISIKPSPSRKQLYPKMVEANRLIEDFLAGEPGTVFVNVYDKMIRPDGSPNPEFFRSDMLHMNERGYALLKKEIEPYLVK